MTSTLPKGTLDSVVFGDFVDRIYLIELEIKDTTDTDKSASYLDLILEIDSEGRLRTKLYDKRDELNSGISYHLRDIYSICRCCWNVATYKWKSSSLLS
jgi:hypothetical protein